MPPLQLATVGALDQWITGKPTFSHFLTRFKRHTRFAIETVETPFDGSLIDFGREITCHFPRDKGDLIRNVTLKVTLPDPAPDNAGRNDNYYPPSTMAHLVEYADILIGDQLISRISGEFIYMYNQLHHSEDDLEQSLYFMNAHGNIIAYSGQWTYYLDLPFWFHKNNHLAIPVATLYRQLITVRVKLRPLSEMLFMGGVQALNDDAVLVDATAKIKNISLETECVFLDADELNYIKSKRIEHVITQVQKSEFIVPWGETKKSVLLKFVNPVKELMFVSQSDYAKEKNLPNNYNRILRAKLQLNGATVFDADNLYLTYAQALRNHVNCPKNYRIVTTDEVGPIDGADQDFVFDHEIQSEFGMFSFALEPQSAHPTGQLNFSRVRHQLFEIEFAQRSTRISASAPDITDAYQNKDNRVRVYAVSYNTLVYDAGLAGLIF